MNDLTVLLLSGGRSKRFWPLSHKMIGNYLGKTFLEHQIETLKKIGFSDIVVVVNQEVSGSFTAEDITLELQTGDGQAAAIVSAREYISDKPLLVLNADDIISPKLLQKFADFSHKKHNFLVGKYVEKYFPGGYLVLKGTFVQKIIEKPTPGTEPSNFTRLVCDYFVKGSDLISYLTKTAQKKSDDVYEQTISTMIASGEQFEMIPYQDTWIPVKYPWATLEVMDYFLAKIKDSVIDDSAKIHKTATISGPVVFESGVRVLEYAKLTGPLYVGRDTIIGNHTLVRASMIGKNTVVGFSSDVTRSYIGDNVWLHSNYVGDSVLSNNVAMGAGAILANLRLDEGEIASYVGKNRIGTGRNKLGALIGENARIGVGAQLMPGVKVGKNSVVGAGVILQKDLQDYQQCFVKQTHVIQKNSLAAITDRDKFRKKL